MPNNGSQDTENRGSSERIQKARVKVVKKCPFLNGWCIGESCALWLQVFHQTVNSLGVRGVTQEGKCSLPALCEIMSSRPATPPQAKSPIDQILRG